MALLSTSSKIVRRRSQRPVIWVVNLKGPDFEKKLENLLHEIFEDESEFDDDVNDSDVEPDYVMLSEHYSPSEQSADNDNEAEVLRYSEVHSNKKDLERSARLNTECNVDSEDVDISLWEKLSKEIYHNDNVIPVSIVRRDIGDEEGNAANAINVENYNDSLPEDNFFRH